MLPQLTDSHELQLHPKNQRDISFHEGQEEEEEEEAEEGKLVKMKVSPSSTASSTRHHHHYESLDDPTTTTSTTSPPHHPVLTTRVVRKLDTILLPFLAILFLLNSLDKSNIGNAETAGFTSDTGLSRADINTSMSVFFFVFVLLQPVGAALGRVVGMRRYVPCCMTLWGLSTLLHIFVRRRWHLVVLRATIAVLESGFYPVTVNYLSLWYTKGEFARRLGVFYGMTAVAGVVGGFLSWGVFSEFPGQDEGAVEPEISHPSRGLRGEGWKSWEVLFLIEGCLTMTVALVGFWWLPRSAESAWFLNKEESMWAEQRMQADIHPEEVEKEVGSECHAGGQGHGDEAHDRLLDEEDSRRHMLSSVSITQDAGLTRHDIASAIFNYKIWHILICNILSAIPVTAFGVLLPILIQDLSPSLNLSPASSNLLSVPPFALGAVVLFLFVAWSDRRQTRLVPILAGLVLLLLGLLMTVLAPLSHHWLRYVSLCVLLSGSFIASPLTVTWIATNTPAPGKRALLLGINGWGNLAGCFMSVLFRPEDRDSGYSRSYRALLACAGASLVGFLAFRQLLVWENRWRANVLRGWSGEELERERRFGDVLAPVTWRSRVARDLGLLALARWVGLEEGRRGDDKLTFRYDL
jgi:MFS family permease